MYIRHNKFNLERIIPCEISHVFSPSPCSSSKLHLVHHLELPKKDPSKPSRLWSALPKWINEHYKLIAGYVFSTGIVVILQKIQLTTMKPCFRDNKGDITLTQLIKRRTQKIFVIRSETLNELCNKVSWNLLSSRKNPKKQMGFRNMTHFMVYRKSEKKNLQRIH